MSVYEQIQTKIKNRSWYILLLMNIMLIMTFFCAKNMRKDHSVNQKENAHLIGASYMTMNNEFYKIMSEEISARVEAEGDRMALRDPALNADRQVQQITEMLDMGIDVLVVTPVEQKGLASVLEQAKKKSTGMLSFF